MVLSQWRERCCSGQGEAGKEEGYPQYSGVDRHKPPTKYLPVFSREESR